MALLLLALPFSLSACGEADTRAVEDPFVAPTLGSTAAPLLLETPTEIPFVSPTPTEVCVDSLTFLEDVTVPDGTVFAQGEGIEKVWLVENDGTCNWEVGYRLRLIAGPPMGVDTEQALFPARSGSEAEIRITFTAPGTPGTYKSTWQAFNPAGEAFGDPIYIEIVVE